MNSSDPLDDGWAELARELNLPEPEPARPKPDTTPGVIPPSEAAAASGTPDPVLAEPTDEVPELTAASDDESDFGTGTEDGEDDGAEAEGAATDGGEAGEKKRRRRRRRRRKKGPGEVDAEAGERPAAATDESEDGDEDEAPAEEEDAAPVGVAAEETSPEMAREIIANWNVPSWDEIVAGLYRPDR